MGFGLPNRNSSGRRNDERKGVLCLRDNRVSDGDRRCLHQSVWHFGLTDQIRPVEPLVLVSLQEWYEDKGDFFEKAKGVM